MFKAKSPFVFAIFCIAACAASAAQNGKNTAEKALENVPAFEAVVTHVSDGDTLWVRPKFKAPPAGQKNAKTWWRQYQTAKEPVKLRLHGIDAPETCQTFGPEAKAELSRLTQRQTVIVEPLRQDDYGRLLARISLAQAEPMPTLNAQLVQTGHAWSYSFRGNSPYRAEQVAAQAQKRGLFAASSPQEPRLFRRQHGSCFK